MKKRGHLLVTSHVSSQFGWRRMCVMVGSILPDFWIPSLIKGHKREVAWDRVRGNIEKLENTGTWNGVDCIRLGVLLHYVEDFFTYVHNPSYPGNLSGHIRYEREQYLAFKQHLSVEKHVIEQMGSHPKDYVDSLQEWLEKMFKEYDEMFPGLETDYLFMKRAAYMTMWHFERAFAINGINRKLNNPATEKKVLQTFS